MGFKLMRILANDGLDQQAQKMLSEYGHTISTRHLDNSELENEILDYDCLIVRSATKVRKNLIDIAKTGQLKLIIRAGVGLDNIDVEYAKEQGINVHNTPAASSNAVAELALAHMLMLPRHLHQSNITMRDGHWNKKEYTGTEVFGKTLGLVGFGRIAQSLAKKAESLGMSVIYDDIRGKIESDVSASYVGKEALVKSSDFISLHIPYDSENGAYLTYNEFKEMKDNVYIINAARGGVVDEADLLRALDENLISGCALDVFETEPVTNKRLYTHEKVSLSPHIGAATKEAQERIGYEIVQIISSYS
jgi:D-3-phosphoglycerate dehydrogenase